MALPVFNFIEKSQTVTRPTAIWRLIAIRIVCVCVHTQLGYIHHITGFQGPTLRAFCLKKTLKAPSSGFSEAI